MESATPQQIRIVGIVPIRNEDWIIGFTLRALLMWVDALVVLLHATTDGSLSILQQISREHPERLTILQESETVWREMSHRQRLLQEARGLGATHVAILDADEVLSYNLIPKIPDAIASLQPGAVLQLYWAHAWRGLSHYRVDGPWADKWASSVFCDAPNLHWKTRNGYDHHHRHPFESLGDGRGPRPFRQTHGAVIHFQHASWRRLLAKQALYKMIERVRWPDRASTDTVDRMYNATVCETGVVLKPLPEEWVKGYGELWRHVDLTRPPWYEKEIQYLLARHGKQRFCGLDMFGMDTFPVDGC